MIKGRTWQPEKVVLKLDKKRLRVKQCPCGKSNNDGKFAPFESFDDKGYCHSCQQTFLPSNSGADNPLRSPDFNLKQCLFGEHLIKGNPTKTVGLVESEKTAIISGVFMTDMVWIATGGKANLKVENCEALKGRDVILYPDLGGYDQWVEKSKDLSRIANVKVSDLLEKIATDGDRVSGLDIADYFLR